MPSPRLRRVDKPLMDPMMVFPHPMDLMMVFPYPMDPMMVIPYPMTIFFTTPVSPPAVLSSCSCALAHLFLFGRHDELIPILCICMSGQYTLYTQHQYMKA